MTKLTLTVHHWTPDELTEGTPARAGWYWGIAEDGVVANWRGPYPTNDAAMNVGNRLVTAAIQPLLDGPGAPIAAPYFAQAASPMFEVF